VPSTAVRRAITLQLAQRHGICANVRFGHLAPWLWARGTLALAAAAPGTPLPARTANSAQAPWQPAGITWQDLAALDDASGDGVVDDPSANQRLATHCWPGCRTPS